MYCTQDDLINRFGEDELIQLTDRDGSTGAVVPAVSAQAITDAGATIDGYIGGRYRLPLSAVPEVLERLACDIARYFLYDRSLDPEHQAAKRYSDAISYLKDVAKGSVQLGLDEQQSKPETTATAIMQSAGSVFTRDQSKGFL
ncbi:gp436 family protein [Vibrio quintilis]|uniref:Mu-like prophage protein gp36 n=1 Tax=Vibrio quintilis TaxID=1117707 RepID=A0A1M7Z2B6_9VIBR|nr:DUF1320 domain-containing protein [Vibrio quintilis]SHO58796.1 hypothetical protein VQ7734_04568 [Vibrio quintilis]